MPFSFSSLPEGKEGTKDSAFRDQQRRSSLTVGGESFSYLHGRYLRNERLRLSEFMSLRGTGAGRDHLRPKAPPEGPLAVWHNCTARPGIKIRLRIPRPRAVFVRAAETCADKSAALRRRFRRALGTGRAFGKLKMFLCPRARFQIQTDVQTEPRDRKTVRAKHEVPAAIVSRETWQ